jgi:hypothetical protein
MSDEKNVEAGAEQQGEQKNKKIKKMSLKEIEKAIEKTKQNQGGLYSKYANELVKQKEYLTSLKDKNN